MPDPRDTPLFLARQGYRQRRLIDAARILPVFGAVLLLVPLLWDGGGGGDAGGPDAPRRLAERTAYVFGVWGLLVLGAAVLGRRLRDGATPPDDPGASARARPARPAASDDDAVDADPAPDLPPGTR